MARHWIAPSNWLARSPACRRWRWRRSRKWSWPAADLPLDQALALERKAFQLLFDSHDQKEGMRAFLEKRTAEYLGK